MAMWESFQSEAAPHAIDVAKKSLNVNARQSVHPDTQ